MKKILVIEDTLEVRENIVEILELDGYEVVAAENGKIGVTLAVAEKPDLILCDVMMPELDGFGVLKILSKQKDTFTIPFIFLTAKAEKADFRKGMGLGADDYITKPFDHVELLEAIESRLLKSENLKATGPGEENLQRFFSKAKAQEELEKLTLDTEIRTLKAGDKIYEEGHNARWLYYVVSGKVKIHQINEFGKELIVQIYTQDNFFGYYPLLKSSAYINNATTLENTTLRLIPKEDFKILLFNNRDFAAQFIKMIANEAESNEQLLIDLAYSSVRKKTANALLKMAQNSNSTLPPISFSASRDNLAEIAGIAKETLIRTLGDFKSEGLIKVEGNQCIILSIEALQNMPQ